MFNICLAVLAFRQCCAMVDGSPLCLPLTREQCMDVETARYYSPQMPPVWCEYDGGW